PARDRRQRGLHGADLRGGGSMSGSGEKGEEKPAEPSSAPLPPTTAVPIQADTREPPHGRREAKRLNTEDKQRLRKEAESDPVLKAISDAAPPAEVCTPKPPAGEDNASNVTRPDSDSK